MDILEQLSCMDEDLGADVHIIINDAMAEIENLRMTNKTLREALNVECSSASEQFVTYRSKTMEAHSIALIERCACTAKDFLSMKQSSGMFLDEACEATILKLKGTLIEHN